jgi:23S rRNA (adenine2030-N6)-methyltransferase
VPDRSPDTPDHDYRHGRHAGNFADVHKHGVLAWLVHALTAHDASVCVLDTHAGDGLYRLEDARRARGLTALCRAGDAPAALMPYLRALDGLAGGAEPGLYPGSPWLVRALLRPGDLLWLGETHPEAVRALRARFREDPQVRVLEQDAWDLLRRWPPPGCPRGLVMVDPPYVRDAEYRIAPAALIGAARRWARGTCCLWYPLVDGRHTAMLEALWAAFRGCALQAELWVEPPGDGPGMKGSGLFVVRPPGGLDDALSALQPWLQARLARRPGGGVRLARGPEA